MAERWDCSGLLHKKNRVLRNSIRWFALRGQQLHYFAEQTDIHPKYVVDLYKANLLPREDNLTFELSGEKFPKNETFVLRAETRQDAERWVKALSAAIQAAQPAVDTGIQPKTGVMMGAIGNKMEKVFGVDLNGDGHIAHSKTPLMMEYQKIKELNAQLRRILGNHGVSEAQIAVLTVPVQSRIAELACRKERNMHARRRVMDELVDTFKERVVHKLHKMDALNKLESSSKKLVFGTAGDVVKSANIEMTWKSYPNPDFGKSMLSLFCHRGIYLDSVSFGCCPIPVLDAREKWDIENQLDPVLWRFKSLMLRLRETKARMALTIQADPSDVHFLINTPLGISTVLKSQAWRVGDRIVLLSCDFRRTKAAAKSVASQFGLEVVTVSIVFPCSDEQILSAVESTLQKLQGLSPKMACVPHVTSDGWTLPVKKLCKLFHRYGVALLVDGTLAVGHFDVNVANISADYYIASLDRWLFAPQGVGFLVVAPHKQEGVFPLTVSYFAGQGFEKEFTYTGLQDFGSYTSVMQSIEFTEKLCKGMKEMQTWCSDLAVKIVSRLEEMWGTRVIQKVGGSPCFGRLPVIPVPNGENQPTEAAHRLMYYLATRYNTNVFCFVGQYERSMLCVRLAIQVFNDISDAEVLGQAVLSLRGDYMSLPPIPSNINLDPIVDME